MTEHASKTRRIKTSRASPGGIAKYIYVFVALCFLTTMSFWTSGYLDFLIPWPFPGKVGVAPDVHDGRLLHEGDAGDLVFHAREIRSQLEIRVDDSGRHDVDFLDVDAGARRRHAAAPCVGRAAAARGAGRRGRSRRSTASTCRRLGRAESVAGAMSDWSSLASDAEREIARRQR